MRYTMGADFSGLNESLATSAFAVARIDRIHKESIRAAAQVNQAKIEREEKMVAGAEANIAQKNLLEKQVDILQNQNELLLDNYTKLKEMYDDQIEANKEAKEELKWNKRFNIIMMIIAVIAMLAAVAGPIITIIVSR